MSNSVTCRHIDTCRPDFLTDHHNRPGDLLIGAPIYSSTRVHEVRAEVIAEACALVMSEDGPDGADLSAAIAECFKGRHRLSVFDRMAPSRTTDDLDEPTQAWFLFTWPVAEEPAPAPEPQSHYTIENYPIWVCHHGNHDIYANAAGYCAAIPAALAPAGCKASHFGDAAYVLATLDVDVRAIVARVSAPLASAEQSAPAPVTFDAWRAARYEVESFAACPAMASHGFEVERDDECGFVYPLGADVDYALYVSVIDGGFIVENAQILIECASLATAEIELWHAHALDHIAGAVIESAPPLPARRDVSGTVGCVTIMSHDDMQPTPCQQQQANAGAMHLPPVAGDVLMTPGSARAYPAAAHAVRRAFNGKCNFLTPDLIGYQIAGPWAVEVSRGDGFRNRDGSAGPDLIACTVVSLETFEAVHALSTVVADRGAAALYIGRLADLAGYRRRRRTLMLRLSRPLNSTRERDAIRRDLAALRADNARTLCRFGAEPIDTRAKRARPGLVSLGDAVHAATAREPASAADNSHCTQPTPCQQPQAQHGANAYRGAPQGKPSDELADFDTSARLQLHRIGIDASGYDKSGVYWGLGKPLYCAADQHGRTAFFRAVDRDAAKAVVRAGVSGEPRFYL